MAGDVSAYDTAAYGAGVRSTRWQSAPHSTANRRRPTGWRRRNALQATVICGLFDDEGRAVGRAGETACALDSLPQSFAVFSGMEPQNAAVALDTAYRLLTDRESGTVQLFTPGFVEPDRAVGYTSAYPAGVRENGGQYTHAAVWLAMALLESGRAAQGGTAAAVESSRKWQKGKGDVYRGEPYALAGDVYHNRECPGRAGWTQYTGAAGWYLTAILYSLLGLRPEGSVFIWRRGCPRAGRAIPCVSRCGQPVAHHGTARAGRTDSGRRCSNVGAAGRPPARGSAGGRTGNVGTVNAKKCNCGFLFVQDLVYFFLEEFSEMR